MPSSTEGAFFPGMDPSAPVARRGGNQRKCDAEEVYIDPTFREKSTGRKPPSDEEAPFFESTFTLLRQQLEADSPFCGAEDGGATFDEFQAAWRGLEAYRLVQPVRCKENNEHLLQVTLCSIAVRPIPSDKLGIAMAFLNILIRARLGRRKADGTLASRKPQLNLLTWWEPERTPLVAIAFLRERRFEMDAKIGRHDMLAETIGRFQVKMHFAMLHHGLHRHEVLESTEHLEMRMPARHSSEVPALAAQLLQAELQLGALSPEGAFLTHFLGRKFTCDQRHQLAINLTDPETRDGALQEVRVLSQQLSIDQEEDDVERGPPVASHGQETGAAGPSSSSSSEAPSGRRGRRGRGRAGRLGFGSSIGEEGHFLEAGGKQQLCQDHVGLLELLLQERNSGRSPKDAEEDGFLTTLQLLEEQHAEEEPYHLPPDGGSSRDELEEAKRALLPYSLKEAPAKDDSNREKIQVIVHVEIGRPIYGDEQRRILSAMNVIFRARVGRRKEDGEWARNRPELFLCRWEECDEVVYRSEDEDDRAAPTPGKTGSDSTPSTRSTSGTRQTASSSTSNSQAPLDPEPTTFGRPSPDGEAAEVGEPSELYPSTPDSLSPREGHAA